MRSQIHAPSVVAPASRRFVKIPAEGPGRLRGRWKTGGSSGTTMFRESNAAAALRISEQQLRFTNIGSRSERCHRSRKLAKGRGRRGSSLFICLSYLGVASASSAVERAGGPVPWDSTTTNSMEKSSTIKSEAVLENQQHRIALLQVERAERHEQSEDGLLDEAGEVVVQEQGRHPFVPDGGEADLFTLFDDGWIGVAAAPSSEPSREKSDFRDVTDQSVGGKNDHRPAGSTRRISSLRRRQPVMSDVAILRYSSGAARSSGVSSDLSAFGIDHVMRGEPMPGGSPTSDGGANGSSGAKADDDDDDNGATTGQQTLLLTVYIVVGCGVASLLVLCVIRKVMDLCLLRNDPSGSLRYAQEEGLSKSSVERLPQAKYRKPVPKPQRGTASRKTQQSHVTTQRLQQAGGLEAGTASTARGLGASLPGSDRDGGRAQTETEAAAAAEAAEMGKADDRDSTEDMCAICLVDYEVGDPLRILPGCRHQFHKECIDPWLETKAVCAYCKAKVEAKKTFCDRLLQAIQDRLGIHLVAPPNDLHHFSSNRRTYTSQEVRQMMAGPNLPPAYRQQNDMDYVGSMVAPRPAAGADAGAGEASTRGVARGLGPAGGTGAVVGARRAVVGGEEPQGAIVVQPVSAPSFTVVPREFSLSSTGADATGGADGGSDANAGPSGGAAGRSTDAPIGGGGGGVSRGGLGNGVIVGGGGIGYGVRVEHNFSSRSVGAVRRLSEPKGRELEQKMEKEEKDALEEEEREPEEKVEEPQR